MKVTLNNNNIRDHINSIYFKRGQDYFTRGKVLKTESHLEGHLLTATVSGSDHKRYHSHIHIEGKASKINDIQGRCSCPVSFNCKHVAAALIHHVSQKAPEKIEMLEPPVKDWFSQLMTAMHSPVNRSSTSELLLYLLDLNFGEAGRQLQVKSVITRKHEDKGYMVPRNFSGTASPTAQYINENDPQILSMINRLKLDPDDNTAIMVGAPGAKLLDVLLDTGRCHWQSEEGAKIYRAGPVQGALVWRHQADGSQVIFSNELKDDCRLLAINPLHYLDTVSGGCGLFESDLPKRLACALVSSPPVPPKDVENLRLALQANFKHVDIPLPEAPVFRPADDITPVPRLRLFNDDVDYGSLSEPTSETGIAELVFEYADQIVNPLDSNDSFLRHTSDGYELVKRDLLAESAAIDQLDELGLMPDDDLSIRNALRFDPVHVTQTWLDFMLIHRHELSEQGWMIEIEDDFFFRLAEADSWYADVDEPASDHGKVHEWFNLRLGVDIDGQKVNLLPFLADLLGSLKGEDAISKLRQRPDDYPLLFKLEDARLLHIPMSKVRHIIDTLVELYDPSVLNDTGQLSLSRYQSAQLAVLESADQSLVWQGGEVLRKFGERLRRFEGVAEVAVPENLEVELRDYQKAGLNWLQFLREYELGGILADDMGLGKTVQALAHLLLEKQAKRAVTPSLVVAPTSLMVNWKREVERFAPSLSVLVLQGVNRKQYFDQIEKYDLVLTTYPLLSRDASVLLDQVWHLIILDEAQHIKNAKSKAAQTVRMLTCRHRLCLTGTPMENHLGELWSQFHFLMPGMLGDERRFRQIFRTPIEKHQDNDRQQQLRERVRPFILRRIKSEVATELPLKTEILSQVELDGAQRDLYETIRVSMHNKIKHAINKNGIARSQIIILDALLKLRQVCCHPQLLKTIPSAQKIQNSAKLSQLMEMLPELVEEGRRILLFSQFTSMLEIIERELEQRDISFVKLTGQTRDRESPIDAFQAGEVPVFIISLKAGGVGLNLTAADTVIHYDPWWNPAVENQATDRAHRIGQDKPVFVYKMITAGTVEEKITAMQERKQALADALFSENDKNSAISSNDLQALFEPLS